MLASDYEGSFSFDSDISIFSDPNAFFVKKNIYIEVINRVVGFQFVVNLSKVKNYLGLHFFTTPNAKQKKTTLAKDLKIL
jgi:hypothetical protein